MGNDRNQIRRFREKKGMSQRQLAAVVGTSQQQIQRYETGSPVKLAMAVDLARSLETTIEKLFPEGKRIVRKIKNKGRPGLHDDPEIDQELLSAGIEVDPCEWTARVLVRGGDPHRPVLYPITVADKDRVRHYLDWGYEGSVEAKIADEHATFFVFDAEDRTVAVNIEHLIFWQNCFDPPRIPFNTETKTENGENEEFTSAVNIYLAGTREPMTFPVEPDEEERQEDWDEGDFRNLLFTLDSKPEKDSFIRFTDVDGETAYFRIRDVAILEIAKDVTNPEPLENEEVADGERTETGGAERVH